MRRFDTFRGFLHKLDAATMDGKGREGTYIFSNGDWGTAGVRAQGEAAPPPATPLAPPVVMVICVMQSANSCSMLILSSLDTESHPGVSIIWGNKARCNMI